MLIFHPNHVNQSAVYTQTLNHIYNKEQVIEFNHLTQIIYLSNF